MYGACAWRGAVGSTTRTLVAHACGLVDRALTIRLAFDAEAGVRAYLVASAFGSAESVVLAGLANVLYAVRGSTRTLSVLRTLDAEAFAAANGFLWIAKYASG